MSGRDGTFASPEFAQFRNWCGAATLPLSESAALASAWERTRETLGAIRGRLHRAELPFEIETVFVCGSMGRMEQVPDSDCDLVIVVGGSMASDSASGRELFRNVWDHLSDLTFERPKSEGIFSQVVSWDQLVSRSSRGVVAEDQSVYGTRIQLLLDSQPVYRSEEFEQLTGEVLTRVHRFDEAGTSDWVPLLTELMRYWRSLCARTFWISPTQPGVRRAITTKLNHSRLVLIAGLLCLLGDASSRTGDSREFLRQRLALTPLERILSCAADRPAAREIVSRYETFLARMSDADFAARLRDPGIEPLHTPEFAELEENARRLKTALMGAIVERSRDWPPAFRESLLL